MMPEKKKYIELDAAIAAIARRPHVKGWDDYEDGLCRGLEEAVNAICAIPAADVRPVVRGKWIRENNPSYSPFDGSSEFIYRCNQCGESNDRDSALCPNCGADMREES